MIKHFSSLTGVDACLFDARLKRFEGGSSPFCERCPLGCDYSRIHLYGCYEAARWDGKYVYYCPYDSVFVAVPLSDEYGLTTGGVIVGPFMMGEEAEENNPAGLPVLDTARVNDLSEVASAVFAAQSSAAKVNKGELLNAVYRELELLPKLDKYPIELEHRLQEAIIAGDGRTSKELLNRLLGDIFLRSNADFTTVKTRALELVVLLSRSAIEGGADLDRIFALNDGYISEINGLNTVDELGAWLTGIINRFIGYVFELKEVGHSVTLRKITRFVAANYMNKITLEDIAEQVHFSKSHVSKIFNEEMGESLTAFVTRVRVEKSKRLLADSSLSIAEVAELTGFETQSYFTKQFKAATGVSPKIFRETLYKRS